MTVSITQRFQAPHARMTGRLTATLLAATALCAVLPSATFAQGLPGATVGAEQSDAPLFLEADTVTYDSDNGVVTAAGGVQIDYGGNRLVARSITYQQRSQRLVASGDVELVQPDGSRIYADTIDVTDDFRDGFVQALRIETAANTRFAARDAVRRDGTVTTFNRGVYTACEACAENPDRPPLWQVKARKIVWDQTEKEIRYYGAQFELFGAPIAYLPYFRSPDPTVKRKSGFLPPSFESSDELGVGVRVPYYIALAPDRDVTLAGTYYTNQGFLAEGEYRQAFENGGFTLKTAGIVQQDPDAFEDDNFFQNGDLVETPDFANEERGMIASSGEFALSQRWTFGWDVMLQSDANFANTYDIEGYDDTQFTSTVYLTGLGDQSFFDLRAQEFQYQSTNPDRDDEQPFVAPSFDYQRIEQEPYFGGELEFNSNLASVYRSEDAVSEICEENAISFRDNGRPFCAPEDRRTDIARFTGLDGSYTRNSNDLTWRDRYTTSWGLVVKPTLGIRGDFYTADMTGDFDADPGGLPSRDIDETGFRGMATAAIEARYPYRITTANTDHVIEPIGQVILRPDETMAGELPNEDAQTLAFNTGNLFSLDKFSGYDRIEGGTRANVGVRYQGTTRSGYGLDAVFGQSYHLAGDNPFDNDFNEPDVTLVGMNSGLENDVSDYVGSVSFSTPVGFSIGSAARFDESDFSVERTDVFGAYSFAAGSASVTYSDIAAQPLYASPMDRSQIGAAGTLKFAENWQAFGSIDYDIENEAVIESEIGFGYADECFSLLLAYESTNDVYTEESGSETIGFRIGLRTISNFSQNFDIDS